MPASRLRTISKIEIVPAGLFGLLGGNQQVAGKLQAS
nr:MAG TPA: hypothetical protein [Caudoviricetes sp.]